MAGRQHSIFPNLPKQHRLDLTNGRFVVKKKALKLNNLINKLFAQFSDTSSVDIDSSKIANSGVNHPE